MGSEEGVVYISQSGSFWSAPEISAETLREASEDEYLREQLDKASSKIFNGMYRLTVRDQDGEEDEDLSVKVRKMVERPKVALWSRMKQCWEDIWVPGAFICRPVWKRAGGEEILVQLMRFDPFSFDTAPSAYMQGVYCDILQGVVLNDADEMEFYQQQDLTGQPTKLKPGVILLKDPTSTRLGGTSKAVYLVPLIKMRSFCANSQMQKVHRIAAPIIFIKVTNPVGDDKAYAQEILKNWSKDVAFQIRPNMEIVTLDLTDNETALNTIHWLEGRIEAPFRGASNLDKEGASIGGNAAAQKDESDDWVSGQRTMIEDLFEGLLQEYLDRNEYVGYSVELQIAVKAAQPGDMELKQAQLGAQTKTLSINEVRERLGAAEKSEEELAAMAEEWSKFSPARPTSGDLFGNVPLDDLRDKAGALKSVTDIDPVDPERYISHEDQLAFLGLKRK
jgi:hypothetical protein